MENTIQDKIDSLEVELNRNLELFEQAKYERNLSASYTYHRRIMELRQEINVLEGERDKNPNQLSMEF